MREFLRDNIEFQTKTTHWFQTKIQVLDSLLEKYIETINEPVVYLLWGGEAQKVSKWIVNPNHIYINSTHPSPLGANKGGWFNTGLFIKCNEFLISKNKNSIKWIKSDI